MDFCNIKRGSKVKVFPLSFYEKHKDEYGDIYSLNNKFFFSSHMVDYCDKILTIEQIFIDEDYNGAFYFVEENGFFWTNEMFVEIIE